MSEQPIQPEDGKVFYQPEEGDRYIVGKFTESVDPEKGRVVEIEITDEYLLSKLRGELKR